MAASSNFMIAEAERRFPVRIRIGVPSDGLGSRLDRIKSWLDENCGASGWAMTPSGTRGVLNDALSIYFGDATLASAFVARWCAGSKIETAGDCVSPDRSRAEMWTNTSFPPSSRAMKPKPLSALNHFTVPVSSTGISEDGPPDVAG
jgi:hypothetical protein